MPRTAHRAVGTNVTDENQLESGNCIDVCVCVCVCQACFLVMLADCSGENRARAANARAMCCKGGKHIIWTGDVMPTNYRAITP